MLRTTVARKYLDPVENSVKWWVPHLKETKEVRLLNTFSKNTKLKHVSFHHAAWNGFQLPVKRLIIINSVKNGRLETRMKINEQFIPQYFYHYETTFSLVKDHLGKSEHLIPFL